MLGESGFERRSHDAYWTEAWVTRALTKRVILPNMVWEPAAGRGDMVDQMESTGFDVLGTDLVDHAGGKFHHQVDFLAQTHSRADAIITNPPYDCAEAFVRHAIKLVKPHSGVACMLLRNEYDCADSRIDMFTELPFARKLVLTKRPRWDWWLPPPAPGEKRNSPRHNFAWFIWDWRHRGPATIEYGQ